MFKKLLFVLCLIIYSCEEIIEVEDITPISVNVLAPTDGTSIESGTINFSWETLEFAENYQLQIATPNFEFAQEIIEDTLISTSSFSKTLPANTYEWRVKAINSAYETLYTTQSLNVEE